MEERISADTRPSRHRFGLDANATFSKIYTAERNGEARQRATEEAVTVWEGGLLSMCTFHQQQKEIDTDADFHFVDSSTNFLFFESLLVH